MAENYLYTEQAIKQYCVMLTQTAISVLPAGSKIPPRDEPKLLATVIYALKQTNTQQLVMIRSWQTSTLIVKKWRYIR